MTTSQWPWLGVVGAQPTGCVTAENGFPGRSFVHPGPQGGPPYDRSNWGYGAPRNSLTMSSSGYNTLLTAVISLHF